MQQLENRLAGETSPYLRQHQHNPVYWQPWNKETLSLARALDRPILLSVGYAACHWCHVMAHECFEDDEVAALMNRHFVNIKVDREERPDIDQIFMTALAAMGEQGGWPLTMFLTPEGEPVWGGTYFPKHAGFGRPGFLQVLDAVARAWRSQRTDLESGARAMIDHIGGQLAPTTPKGVDGLAFEKVADAYAELLDPVHGGLRGAPKFPNVPIIRALWLSSIATGNRNRAGAVIFSLSRMLAGGIYDHVGGGLCRYATDEAWILPHFEKMLYDNAQLIDMLCLTAPYGPGDAFRTRIAETITWLEREMTTPTGAYASSLDADSEGQEGRFYLWRRDEIESLPRVDLALFDRHFRLVRPSGWEHDPILVRVPIDSRDELEPLLAILLHARAGRVRPGRDDKVLTDWNGLAIRAIADAGRQFAEPRWTEIARRVFFAIPRQADGRLPHSTLGTSALYPAFSTDYAAMILAAVSLYQSTLDGGYLREAQRWSALLDEDHTDGQGGYYLTSSHAQDVPLRIRGDQDEAIPSATAQIIEALTRLAVATGDLELFEKADRCARQAQQRIGQRVAGHAAIHYACQLAMKPTKLVAFGEDFTQIVRRHPDPHRVDLNLAPGKEKPAGLLPGGLVIDAMAQATYICPGQTCLPPYHTPEALAEALDPFRAEA